VTANDFDGYAYEREQGLRFNAAAETLRALPEFQVALDRWGRGPAVLLVCSKGHPLIPVMAYLGRDDRMEIGPLPDHTARRTGAVTFYAEPWRQGSRVCLPPGCPKLIEAVGTCEHHGGTNCEQREQLARLDATRPVWGPRVHDPARAACTHILTALEAGDGTPKTCPRRSLAGRPAPPLSRPPTGRLRWRGRPSRRR